MLATIINAIAILIGGLVGLAFRKRLNQSLKDTVFVAAGMLSLVIGILMAVKTQYYLYLALSLVGGGVIGAVLRIEDGVLYLGESMRKLGLRIGGRSNEPGIEGEKSSFALGFLESSVLFCVGPMAILGCIQVGTGAGYQLLFTKSVMDCFIAILLAAGLGSGVLGSALSVLVYQGLLTLLAGSLQNLITPAIETMISSVGGPMVMMIGINLLGLRRIPTANFLPALLIGVALIVANPWIPEIFQH